MRSILSHAPRALFLSLPKSVEHRRLLQALASAGASFLPVREEWLLDPSAPGPSRANNHPPLSRTDLAALLGAVEPVIAGGEQPDLADQAAAAALEFLRRQDLWELSDLDDFADLAILRGRDPGTDEQVVLTLKESCERSRNGLLFRSAPTAKTVLRKLARALPDARPVIVSGKTAQLLAEHGGSTLRLLSSDKPACLDLVDATSRFGDDTDRAELIDALQVAEGDDRTALRRLCAGRPEAGMPAARLAAADGLSPEIERVVARCMSRDESMFLVPRRIVDGLSWKQREYIGIGILDSRAIEAVFVRNADALARSPFDGDGTRRHPADGHPGRRAELSADPRPIRWDRRRRRGGLSCDPSVADSRIAAPTRSDGDALEPSECAEETEGAHSEVVAGPADRHGAVPTRTACLRQRDSRSARAHLRRSQYGR